MAAKKSGNKKSGKSAARSKTERRVRREAEKAIRKIPIGVRIAIVLIVLLAVAAFLLYQNYYVDPLSNWFKNDPVNTISGKAEGELRVHFVDVGQGDGMVVELPDGKIMVIDGGPRSAKSKMLNYLKALNVTAIDYAVLTHADEDHVGSLDDVLNAYSVKDIYMPGMTTSQITTTVYKQFNEAVDKKVKAGAVKHITDNDSDIVVDNGTTSYLIDFFANDALYERLTSKSSAEAKNGVSPFMFLTYAGKKVLFTGDGNFDSEEWLLGEQEIKSAPASYDVDVLKVGHHGSATSTRTEFLKLVQPEYAVISCGLNNKYDHPRPEALARLGEANIFEEHIYRTDQQGDIILTLNPQTEAVISFHVEKGEGTNGVAYVVLSLRSEWTDATAGAYIDRRRAS